MNTVSAQSEFLLSKIQFTTVEVTVTIADRTKLLFWVRMETICYLIKVQISAEYIKFVYFAKNTINYYK